MSNGPDQAPQPNTNQNTDLAAATLERPAPALTEASFRTSRTPEAALEQNAYGPQLRDDPLFKIHELIQNRNISENLTIPRPAPGALVQGGCGMGSDLAYHCLREVYGVPEENLMLHQVGKITENYENNPARPTHAILLIKDAHQFFGGPPRDILFDATAAQFDGSPGVMGTNSEGNLMKYLQDRGGETIVSDLHFKGYVDLPHDLRGDHKLALLISGYRAGDQRPDPELLPVQRDIMYTPTRELDLTLEEAFRNKTPEAELAIPAHRFTLPGEEADPWLSRALSPEERAAEIQELESWATYGVDDLPPVMRSRYDRLISEQG